MGDESAFVNGRFVPASELLISPADAGFVYGATATDLVRTFRGRLFRLEDHLRRFRESCRIAAIPLEVSDADLAAAAERLIAANRRQNAELALVMFATPGPLGRYAGKVADGPPTIAMHTMPIRAARYRRLFTEGARLIVPSIRAPRSIDPRAKVRSRLHWWLAEHEARTRDPGAWALLVDEHESVTETAAANLLAVVNGGVVTPPRSEVLNGISLNVTEEICGWLGIPFVERPLPLSELLRAEEAMLTGTMFCLAGVQRIDGAEYSWPGPVTERLQRAWMDLVGDDFVREFTESTAFSG